ncbi:MAG: hypothetical protein NWE91_06165 [Candidatus Bathyarchaeota archaeon]|nr:hypothetical protein [Candidatus Bathyarchaeota archaeon]
MKKIGLLGTVGTAIVLIWSLLSQTNVVSAETMNVPLNSAGSNVFTAEFAHIPLLINGIAVDISVKANSYLTIWCEFRIGDHDFKFTLNDLSLEYHLERDRIEVDGKVSKNGIGYFKATVDTDGIIEGVPKLVLSYYSINLDL